MMMADDLAAEKVGLMVYAKAEISAADLEIWKVGSLAGMMVAELVDLMVSRGVDVMAVCWAVWTVSESAALRVDTSEYEGAVAKAVELVA